MMPGPHVTINIDDIGMCHGANSAFVALSRAGRVDSGSLMLPCPWALEMIELGLADTALKIGIHLTLTSEKRHYRWRPLTAPGRAAGLVDDDGYQWRSVPELRRHARPGAVEAELRAQIEAFLATGLRPAHMDGHMGAVLSPEFYDIYIALGREYGIPTLYPASILSYGPRHNLGQIDDGFYRERATMLRDAGCGVVDSVLETPWHLRGTAEQRYLDLFGQIGEGVTFFALHANAPGEISVIEPDSADMRIQEYGFLVSDGFGRWLDTHAPVRGTLPA
ncbi:polysaccharide deacetylase family protein [Paracoccus sp. (in: a-proteobacteria)]|uniref:polysaccharide deacetylase family protein n=1 Tax=Paracoccus sp. TaxID=267 RepID=UPI003A8B0E23